MVMITPDDIAELRARLAESRAELAEDIEQRERELEDDPNAFFEQLAADTTVTKALVFKTRMNGPRLNGDTVASDANGNAGNAPPVDPALLDALGDAIGELLEPLRERLTVLEARVDTLLAVLGGNGNGAGTKALSAPRKRRTPPT